MTLYSNYRYCKNLCTLIYIYVYIYMYILVIIVIIIVMQCKVMFSEVKHSYTLMKNLKGE